MLYAALLLFRSRKQLSEQRAALSAGSAAELDYRGSARHGLTDEHVGLDGKRWPCYQI